MFKKIGLAFLLLGCQHLLLAQNHNLDYYINTGLKNSPLLYDYQQQIGSGLIDSLKVLATFKPQVNLNGQAYYTPNIKDYGYDAAITNNGNYVGQVQVMQQLIMKRSKRAQIEGINISNQYINTSASISEQDLRKAITTQYITAYADYLQLQTTNQQLAVLASAEELLKPLVQRGLYAQTDFLNIHINKETQALTSHKAQMQYTFDLYALNIICGIDDTVLVNLDAPVLAANEAFDESNALLLRTYRIDSLKFNNKRKLIDLNYQPHLAATADAGFLTSDPSLLYKRFGAGIGLNFTMPLYDGKQRKLEYQRIELQRQVSHKYEQFYKTQYRQQIAQLRKQLKDTEQLMAETNQQMLLSKDLVDIYHAQLEKGLVKIADMVLALNNYIGLNTNVIQLQVNRLQIINQLNYFK